MLHVQSADITHPNMPSSASKTIGIPRALYFYKYYPLWSTFFLSLGYDVVFSPETSGAVLDAGLRGCVHDVCLPIKAAYGHTSFLKNSADFLFLPRLLSLRRGTYICPKIVAFPDLVKGTMERLPRILDPEIDSRRKKTHSDALKEAGRVLGAGALDVKLACRKAAAVQAEFEKRFAGQFGSLPHPELNRAITLRGHRRAAGWTGALAELWGWKRPGRTEPPFPLPEVSNAEKPTLQGKRRLGLLGRPYALFDPMLSFGLVEKLRNSGFDVLTPQHVPAAAADAHVSHLPIELYWTVVAETVGVAKHWLSKSLVDGIVYLLSFECGPDSLTKVLLEDALRDYPDIPYTALLVDEHSAETGFLTRIEAFLDILDGVGSARS
jgi:predicted nucleotide-binding protein (sugar kinase/HSP70/actin superfamily)